MNTVSGQLKEGMKGMVRREIPMKEDIAADI